MTWIDRLPSLVVRKEPSGKRYVYSVDPYLMSKSTLVFQLAFVRCWMILDTMDSENKILSSVHDYAHIDTDEVCRIIHEIEKQEKSLKNLYSGRQHDLISRIYPARHGYTLALGIERVLPLYDGVRYPQFTIWEMLKHSYVRDKQQFEIAECVDNFFWKCAQDKNFTGTLNFSKELQTIKDLPLLKDELAYKRKHTS